MYILLRGIGGDICGFFEYFEWYDVIYKKSFNDIDSFTACYPIKLFAGKWSDIFKLI